MNYEPFVKNVSADQIILNEDFDINAPFIASVLPDSIKKIGIITPLTVFTENESYVLLDGFQRLRVARKLNVKKVPVIIIKQTPSFEELIDLRHELQRSVTEEPNVLQKARIFKLILNYIEDEQKREKWRQRLKLPKGNRILAVLGWPENAQLYLIKYHLSFNQIKTFLDYKKEDIEALFDFAATLSMRAVELLKLSELISEITMNEDKSVKSLLAEEQIKKILNNDEINRNQKTVILKDLFYQRRFPLVSAYRNEMNKLIKNLKKSAFSVSYDKNFERSGVQLNAQLKNKEDLYNLINALRNSETENLLTEMLKRI